MQSDQKSLLGSVWPSECFYRRTVETLNKHCGSAGCFAGYVILKVLLCSGSVKSIPENERFVSGGGGDEVTPPHSMGGGVTRLLTSKLGHSKKKL